MDWLTQHCPHNNHQARKRHVSTAYPLPVSEMTSRLRSLLETAHLPATCCRTRYQAKGPALLLSIPSQPVPSVWVLLRDVVFSGPSCLYMKRDRERQGRVAPSPSLGQVGADVHLPAVIQAAVELCLEQK